MINTNKNFLFSTTLKQSKFKFFFKNYFFVQFLKFLLKKGLKLKVELVFLKGFLHTKSVLLSSSSFVFLKVKNKRRQKIQFFKSFKYFLVQQLFNMNLLHSYIYKSKKKRKVKLKKVKYIYFQKKNIFNFFKYMLVQ